MIDIEELARLEKAATPGPWHSTGPWVTRKPGGPSVACDEYRARGVEDNPTLINCSESRAEPARANALLIAAIRNELPALLAELAAARKVVEAARAHAYQSVEVMLALEAYDAAAKGET